MTSTTVHGKSGAEDDEKRTGHQAPIGWMRSGGVLASWLLVLAAAGLCVTFAVVWNSQRNSSVLLGSESRSTVDHEASALVSAKGFELHAAFSPLGTILCVDSGEVVQYARVGTELINGENLIRETNDSCQELTEEIQAMARHRLYAGELGVRHEEAPGDAGEPSQGKNNRAVPRDAVDSDKSGETTTLLNSAPTGGDTEGLIVDLSPLSDSVGYELYVGLSPQGTVLCSDNGVVEPYAIVEGELRGAEDQVREWTPECSLVVEEPKTVTTIKEDDQIHIEMITPGELEVFDSLEELIAKSRAVQREQETQSTG